MIVLGIESTAHTFGIGIVENGKILSNMKKTYTTKKGGIIPIEAAKHHKKNKEEIYLKALEEAKVKESEINVIAFSQGPGLAPCLIEGMKFAKELSLKLKKPIVPVNHCIAHLEIGRTTGAHHGRTPKDFKKKSLQGAKNPVMLYASGANTQIIAYASGKYRIFGETLDIGVGNFIDNFARYLGIGFPGGPKIEKLAKEGRNYIELPYKVKGMDIVLSGILTNLRQKIESGNLDIQSMRLPSEAKKEVTHPHQKGEINKRNLRQSNNCAILSRCLEIALPRRKGGVDKGNLGSLYDLVYSMQETVFAMLVEVSERALAHTEKNELLLGGGVACNKRLQEMCKIMCKERNAKFFCPENSLLVDNGAMIAFLGEIMFNSEIKFSFEDLDKIDIKPRQRTDDVNVTWK